MAYGDTTRNVRSCSPASDDQVPVTETVPFDPACPDEDC